MQIISGLYKNSPLKSPNDEKTHPMGSREKLALFNMLNGQIEGKTVLDAFAGSGALGLEALSRGAKSVVFVEKSPKIAQTLRKNIAAVTRGQSSATSVVIADATKFQSVEKFDLIFADPPYYLYSEALLSPLVKFLAKSAILCVSLPKTAPSPVLEGLVAITRRNYASASLIIFQKP